MTNQWGLDRPNRRKQQMKRELIGLVTGSVFLLTGTAFLFNHSLNSGDATTTPPPSDTQPAPVMAAASINDTPERAAPTVDTTVVTPTVATVAPSAPTPTPIESRITEQQTTGATTASSADTSTPATATPPATEVITTNATMNATTGGTDAATTNTPAPSAPTEATTATTQETPAVAASAGWIYAGQFVNGHWAEKGLSIGNELPVAGQTYTVSWGATVRSSPPSKNAGGKHAAIKGNIAAGKKVKVLQVKESGTKGHVWLEIAQ